MKSTQESVEDLMEILSPAAKDIITDEQVKQAQAAAASGDKHLAGKVLGDIWKQVAEKAAGLGLERLDSDAFGKKIGWLTSQQHSEKTVRDFLAKYKRELAIQPMQEATNNLFALDSTTEVVRESVVKHANGVSDCAEYGTHTTRTITASGRDTPDATAKST